MSVDVKCPKEPHRCTMAQIALKMPIYSATVLNTLIMKILGLVHALKSNLHSFIMSGQRVA